MAAKSKYFIRIDAESNPLVTPNPNVWTITYNGVASDEIPGFELWTFSELALSPVDKSITAGPIPVTIYFKPFSELKISSDLVSLSDAATGVVNYPLIFIKIPSGYRVSMTPTAIDALACQVFYF
jgi:hypothetical protein